MSWALHKGALMGAAGPTHEARDERGSRGRLRHGRDLPPATCTDLQRGKQQEEEKKPNSSSIEVLSLGGEAGPPGPAPLCTAAVSEHGTSGTFCSWICFLLGYLFNFYYFYFIYFLFQGDGSVQDTTERF